MESLQIIMNGLTGIAGSIFNSGQQNQHNEALNSYNAELLARLNSQNQQNNTPLYILGAATILAVVLIATKK